MATGNTQAGRNGNGGSRRVAGFAPRVVVVVGVLLLAGFGLSLAPQHARAASYPCTEAGPRKDQYLLLFCVPWRLCVLAVQPSLLPCR